MNQRQSSGEKDQSHAGPQSEPAHQSEQAAGANQQAGDAATRRMLGSDATSVADHFYRAFAARDTDAMRASYDPSVQFHDPLFGDLHGAAQVMEMWTSIMPKANPFQISPSVQAGATPLGDGSFQVRVHWDAHYGLGKRLIDNHSETTLVVKDGKIVSQKDEWNLSAWTKEALPTGLGGNALANGVLHLAAHSFIEILDLIRKLQAMTD